MSSERTRGLTAVLAISLCLAVVAVYFPALRAGFVWDDDVYVVHNRLLSAPDGLRRIWFSRDSPSQYFPLVYTAFRMEHALWGLNPTGYHLVNILLHAVNALLLWRVLLLLRVPAPWLGAALFALHPVQVESVAWITELKNVLSTFFALLTVRSWLGFLQGEFSRGRWYGACLLSFALALFSKTTTATLPVALLLLAWFRQGRISRRHLAAAAPLLALGFGMGMFTIWWERTMVGTRGVEFSYSLGERFIIAGRALFFYVGKLFWPANLAFSYPRWSIEPGKLVSWIWPAAAVAVALIMWRRREALGRGPALAAGFYLVSLAPLLGFIPLYTFRYTFVADHYQHLASIGPLALAAAGLSCLAGEYLARPGLRRAAAAILLALLGFLAWRQAHIYLDSETLWRDTLAKNPGSWMARHNLASTLEKLGRRDEAMATYREVLRIKPDHEKALINLGLLLMDQGRLDEAIGNFQSAVRAKPDYAPAYNNLGLAMAERGDLEAAIHNYRRALSIEPGYPEAWNNLGGALFKEGMLNEAVACFRKALRFRPDFPDARYNLDLALSIIDAVRGTPGE